MPFPRLGRAIRAGVASLALLGGAASADQPDRPAQDIAVVIGIQDYEHVEDLKNTRADARAIAEMMRGFGYDVHEGYDLNKREFEAMLRRAALNIREGARVFFYYAGHGVQLGRRNYLLTREVAFDEISDLPFETVTLDRVSSLLGARAGEQFLMLDSCRNNPVADAKLTATLDADLYEARQGFEVFRPPLNTLVAFSTSPGQTSFDGGQVGNSPYTRAVVELFPARPEDNAIAVLSEVRARVVEATGRQQVPWESSTLIGPMVLGDDRGLALAAAAAPPDGAPAGTGANALRRLGDGPIPVSVTSALDRQIDLTGALSKLLNPEISVEVTQQPSLGHLSVDGGGAGLPSVTLRPALSEIPAVEGIPPVTGRATLRLVQDNAEREVTVDVTLVPDACDVEAGAPFDLQGVGLYRYPDQIDPEKAETACRKAVERSPETGRFHHQLGRALQAQGRIDAAYAAYRRAYGLGHVRAGNSMAFLHLQPTIDRGAVSVPHDPGRAEALMERGVAAGDPYAQHSLGRRLLTSEDEATRERGFELLSRAVELGHTYAMNNLGMHFLRATGEEHQPERGLAYLKASADRGDIYGINNLGRVRLEGLDGKKPDPQAAEAFFRQASAAGHPTAPATLGRMALRGEAAESGPRAALEWFDIALARGDAWGGANGAWIVANPLSDSLENHEAAMRAGKALVLGNPDAAEAAREVLDALPPDALAAATQAILRDLGATIAVDGFFGENSRAALLRQAETAGLAVPAEFDPLDRLTLAARLHFVANPVRTDLF